MTNELMAALRTFLFAAFTFVVANATGLLDKAADWFNTSFPGNETVVTSAKALALAAVIAAVNWLYYEIQKRLTFLPGAPPEYPAVPDDPDAPPGVVAERG